MSELNDAEHWKEKYFSLLGEFEDKEKSWAETEEHLKKAANRLSIVAEGVNSSVDRYLVELRKILRQPTDTGRLTDVIERISQALLSEKESSSGGVSTPSEIVPMKTLLEAVDFPKSFQKRKASLLKKMSSASSGDDQAMLDEVADLLRQAIGVQKAPAVQTGFLGRLFSHSSEAGHNTQEGARTSPQLSAEARLDIELDCLDRLLKQIRHPEAASASFDSLKARLSKTGHSHELSQLMADTAETLSGFMAPFRSPLPSSSATIETPELQEVLVSLLEMLMFPVSLQDEVEALKQRLEQCSGEEAWNELIKEVAARINAIHGDQQQEKEDFESFLQQITSRLQGLDNFLQDENVRLETAHKNSENLDRSVADQMQSVRDSIEETVDLKRLKEIVQSRLDTISEHMQNFLRSEDERYALAKDNLNEMQQRVSDLEQETDNLRHVIEEKNKQAKYDVLTGIPNRLAYEQRLAEDVDRWVRFETPLTLAVWDVDHFKRINDKYGHKAGDKVLRTIARLLNKRIRKTDFLARYGGEEFVMLLSGTVEEESLRLVNELREAVQECGFHYQGESVKITISCGVSGFHANDSPESVFERADKALYQAKQSGRNRCVIASCLSR